MSPLFGRPTRSVLPALAAVALFAAVPRPAVAQPATIDFGQSMSEDSLLGGGGGAVNARPLVGWRDTTSEPRYPTPPPSGRYERRSASVFAIAGRPRASFIRGTGIFANSNPGGGSLVYLGAGPGGGDGSFGADGPRFIDVAAERLDRQPIGPNGITVHRVGTAKIIRIASNAASREGSAPEKDMAPLPAPAAGERAPAPVPTAPPRAQPAEEEEIAPPAEPLEDAAPATETEGAAETERLEPWTDEWLADCVDRYDSFDASLGTYVAEDGRRRFCTGDPA